DMVDGRTAETCNVYNMLKMTRTLFSVAPDIRYADFQERALFNHILASQDPRIEPLATCVRSAAEFNMNTSACSRISRAASARAWRAMHYTGREFITTKVPTNSGSASTLLQLRNGIRLESR